MFLKKAQDFANRFGGAFRVKDDRHCGCHEFHLLSGFENVHFAVLEGTANCKRHGAGRLALAAPCVQNAFA